MVFFLNSKVKTHTEDALQYIFDENKEKIVILGYSIVSKRSPLVSRKISFLVGEKKKKNKTKKEILNFEMLSRHKAPRPHVRMICHVWHSKPIPMSLELNFHQFAFFNDPKPPTTSRIR